MSFDDDAAPEHSASAGWSTRAELGFLESLWGRCLAVPLGQHFRIDYSKALDGYARGFYLRRHWGGVEWEVVERWLMNHGFGFILQQAQVESHRAG